MSRVTLPILDAVTLKAACTHIIAEARAAFARLASLPLADVSPATVLDEWDRIGMLVENIEGPISILNNVHPDKSVRDAADDAIRELSAFQIEIFQNEALYERVRAVAPSSPAERQLRKDLVESFEDTGVTLPEASRARARAIAERITALYQEFSRNLRDNQSRVAFTADELRGLPEPFLARQPRDAEGRYLLSFDAPDFNPFMANAENEDARRRYYIAYLNRGTARNVGILDEVMSLRHELAGLYGLPSFAHFVLRRRMAATPDAVERFLGEVRAAVEQAERRDLDELRALKAERAGTPLEKTTVSRWDIAFLSERLRERRYSVDQESLRAYFPPDATLEWLLDVSGEVFHALEEPTSLNTLELLPRLAAAGVVALKIEGRQRGQAYVASVTRTWRAAIDRLAARPEGWQADPQWLRELSRHAEGHQTTLGPYHRSWH